MNYKSTCEKLSKLLMEDVKENEDLQTKLNKYRDLAQEAMFLLASEEVMEKHKDTFKRLAEND